MSNRESSFSDEAVCMVKPDRADGQSRVGAERSLCAQTTARTEHRAQLNLSARPTSRFQITLG
jgi:hypothetical protein